MAGSRAAITTGLVKATGAAPSAPVDLDRLPAEDRQALVQRMLERSPGIYVSALFAPELGYTLVPGAPITAWDDSFTSNELGFRTGPVAKRPGPFRILFLGDSWTYGMGVTEEQSFPRQLELLAGMHSGREERVESWTLALPGYNTLNETAALSVFFDRLEPDMVVLCPTMNDIDSANNVLPNGSPTRLGVTRDGFGSPHSMHFRARLIDSWNFRGRWRTAFDAVRHMEAWLQEAGVPLLVFFVATWEPAFAHRLIGEAGIESPYVVLPKEYAAGEYRNPRPIGHATVEANRLYARILYRAIQSMLDWRPLPEEPSEPLVPAFEEPPPGEWILESDAILRRATADLIATTFEPSLETLYQMVGPMRVKDGLIERSTTLLVRKERNADTLRIVLRRVPGLDSQQATGLRLQRGMRAE